MGFIICNCHGIDVVWDGQQWKTHLASLIWHLTMKFNDKCSMVNVLFMRFMICIYDGIDVVLGWVTMADAPKRLSQSTCMSWHLTITEMCIYIVMINIV